MTGDDSIIGYDPFNMPTAQDASQFDPAYANLMNQVTTPAPKTTSLFPPEGKQEGGPVGETPPMVPASTSEAIPGEMPAELRDIIRMAIVGEIPANEASQLLNEIQGLFPDNFDAIVAEITNEIRIMKMREGGRDNIVTEGFIPFHPDAGPQSSGAVDDRLAVPKDDFVKADFEERLARGGPIPVAAAVTAGEFIVNKDDVENATKEELLSAASAISPETPPGAAVWEDFVGNINV
jgi:hypothetical protein